MSKCTLYASLILMLILGSCTSTGSISKDVRVPSVAARDILGDPAYKAMSYGGYRTATRDIQPSVDQIKEDMRILHALGVRIIRTYNVHFAEAENVLKAIRSLQKEEGGFEMYVMLGAWINCAGAFTDSPDHEAEDIAHNEKEVAKAVALAQEYPEIVKVLAIGNEAMVKWATGYFVQPAVILRYVEQVQALKTQGALPKDLWVTSSDNFASWGGGEDVYHTPDLERLARAVDFISLHTYPMHDTHYNPAFWGVPASSADQDDLEQIKMAMEGARDYAISQYQNTKMYLHSIGVDKPIHIGETGWASASDGYYGDQGSRAADEYKAGMYYKLMREWTEEHEIACFYFEAFDESWKDAQNPLGSENHFGLFTIEGEAKYAVWSELDEGRLEGLSRDGHAIQKTYDGVLERLLEDVSVPPSQKEGD